VVQGSTVVLCLKVGACVSGSWCFHPFGAETLREFLLPSSGF
jgi:hypothetical protein